MKELLHKFIVLKKESIQAYMNYIKKVQKN